MSLLLLLASTATAEESTEACAANTPTLHYFNIRGRAEAIRMAMHDQGIEFKDHSFSSDEWGKEQSDGLKAKWNAEGKLAFGQVPMLEVDGMHIVQSHAILRYLGRKHGWYEGTPHELVRVDLVADGTEDVRLRLKPGTGTGLTAFRWHD